VQKLPVVDSKKLLKLLNKLGYSSVRQKGSHIILKKEDSNFVHTITVPFHKEIAKGTLNDILAEIAKYNNMKKEEILEILNSI
jgi:predicted RNA binding protein YcfA (HicA-like mRNA interferase family)